METVIEQSPPSETIHVYDAEILVDDGSMITVVEDPVELSFELDIWISAIEIFLRKFDPLYLDNHRSDTADKDWEKVFRITYSALLRCAEINNSLRSYRLNLNGGTAGAQDKFGLSSDTSALSQLLRNAIMLNLGILRGDRFGFEDWKSFGTVLSDQIRQLSAPAAWFAPAGFEDSFLPTELRSLLASSKITESARAELRIVIPRFVRILKSLNMIGRMLRDDEPLKPCLPIFFVVFDQVHELVDYLNGWLSRCADEDSELFGLFDAASYTATLELKKVEFQELGGFASLRSAPAVYARVESAYALLNDNLQQILAGFARLAEPGVLPPNVFPEFKLKLDRSLLLRNELASIVGRVQAAEIDPEKQTLNALKESLDGFLAEPIAYLFYKDRETFERFCEEIFAGTDKKDLVPVLHRFAAYLETLFGQVNMRTVLANHPFEVKA